MKESLISYAQFKEHHAAYDVHYHYNHEILYITNGTCEIEVNDALYVAKKGDVLLVCNLENHSTKILEAPYSRYVLNINPAVFNKAIGNNQLIAMFKQRSNGFRHCLPMENTGLEQIFEKILLEKQNPGLFSESLCALYLKELLITIFRKHPENFQTDLDKTSETVLAIENYIDRHFQNDIRIDELAKQFFLNKYYLSHSFKTFSGVSPKQYLTQVRLNHAMHLLSETRLSVSEICEQCGFSDINNFIRIFKTHFSQTPGEYRKKNS